MTDVDISLLVPSSLLAIGGGYLVWESVKAWRRDARGEYTPR